MSIPFKIAEKLPEATREIERKERGIIDMFSAPDFDPAAFTGEVKH